MTAITKELAEFIAGMSYETLPTAVRERTKALALDLTGIALRAKFDRLVAPYLSADHREELASALHALDAARDTGTVLRLTRSPASSARLVAAASR